MVSFVVVFFFFIIIFIVAVSLPKNKHKKKKTPQILFFRMAFDLILRSVLFNKSESNNLFSHSIYNAYHNIKIIIVELM